MTDETQSKSELKRMAVMNPGKLYEENEKLQRQVNAMRILLDAANEELNKRKWLPIESAPKDGIIIFLYQPIAGCQYHPDIIDSYDDYYVVGWFDIDDNKWHCFEDYAIEIIPSHWMPLPDTPKE